MAYFAKIEHDVVTAVIAVPDEQEHRGADFLIHDLGLSGEWIQTSYNNRIRKQYAGIGFTYDRNADVFVAPQPFPSWTLDINHDWQPPVPRPVDDGHYQWDEKTRKWVPID